MTRTDTRIMLGWAVTAWLAYSTSGLAAENLPSLSRPSSGADGWAVATNGNPFRGQVETAAWQPNRSNSTPPFVTPASAEAPAAPTQWLAPKKAVPPAKRTAPTRKPTHPPSAKSHGASEQAVARSPKPFVPPADAEAQALPTPNKRATQPAPKPAKQVAAARKTTQPTNQTAAQATPSAARQRRPAPAAKIAQSTNQRPRTTQRPAHPRPRPAPTSEEPMPIWDTSGWIRPLRQVAYQLNGEGGGEVVVEQELPVPPDYQPMMSPGPGMSESYTMPEEGPYYGPPGPGMPGPGMSDGEWIGPPGGSCSDGMCGDDCYYGGECGSMCGDGCEPACGCASGHCDSCSIDLACGIHDDEACEDVRIRLPKFQEAILFAGVHGFKGPFDQERNTGNFGFQEGFNLGAKVPFVDCGYQFGFQSIQSQLSGDANTDISDPFAQQFFTAGLFRRQRDGWQGGLVWDLLLDPRDTTTDFHQLRGEASFVDCGRHELGGMIAVHLADQVLFDGNNRRSWQPLNQFLAFYRMHGANGGEGRLFAGLSDSSDGIVGADFLLPLKEHWSLQTGFTYVIPEEPAGVRGSQQEVWNLGINLVWHWKGRARESHANPYRPLFNVADNGSLIIDDRP